MNYEETLSYLYKQLPVFQQIGAAAYKPGLQNSEALDEYFGHPHRKFRTIHVAGTNGKGSTSHLIAAILQQSGYKTGLYTSPHLVDFRERIRVNGEMISKEFIMDFTRQHLEPTRYIHPSFFELTMMMAFEYFASCKIDVAIIEVGLGGRLDSTNIISPDLSIITNISYDHMQFLGDTLSQIATEKAGIMKKNIPVIIGEANGKVKEVFEKQAKKIGAPIFFAEEIKPIKKSILNENGGWFFENDTYPHLYGELGGYCQEKNAATVLTAIEQLIKSGYHIHPEAVYEGFSHITSLTGLQGRWQAINNSPQVFCDTGHNTGGMQYIVYQLSQQKYRILRIVLGMVNDKDINGVLQMLPKNAVYYFTQASVARAMPAEEIKHKAKAIGLSGNAYPTVEAAYKAALKESDKDDFIFIGGSSFIVADLLKSLEKR
ncbi:bifunctional folylpolyglutamate synthase/dihydrofolate synthase [Coprobacter tertius]|uniref:Dihydrofolate synthase/folylpolyglutamate synthase n=1 Tax=Coprobacter tertius TaxID=2944915 RepID=A0ABT1MG00_9BACT|nr:folylpolyglutamate synthase/dihydrofolate synthase family protein [Coprobacter tertius]MCP9611281.1 bifunctional folylpolyglutamate synthase/dihydrofolate synthase [Coprobacter tertius]